VSDAKFSEPGLAAPSAWTARPDRNPAAAGPAGKPLVPVKAASPRLRDDLFARLLAYGTPQPARPGDVLFRPGDQDVDLIVVAEGRVDVIRTETGGVPAATVDQV
jgi:CRP-like cAMP-binding protein